MNKLYSLLILLLLSSFSYSQTADTIWYNSKWVKTNVKADRYYYSVVNFDRDKNLYYVTDYYPDGSKQMEGVYSSLEPKVKNGEFTWYQANGMKKYYALFRNDTIFITETFDESGKSIDRILKKEYIETLSSAEKEKLGLRVEIEEPAEFPGGEEKLQEFISSNIRYPEEAIENKIEGTVYVLFNISTSGKVKDVTTPKNDYPILEKEAERVILSMPRWKPGKDKGKIVEDSKALPITFKL